MFSFDLYVIKFLPNSMMILKQPKEVSLTMFNLLCMWVTHFCHRSDRPLALHLNPVDEG